MCEVALDRKSSKKSFGFFVEPVKAGMRARNGFLMHRIDESEYILNFFLQDGEDP